MLKKKMQVAQDDSDVQNDNREQVMQVAEENRNVKEDNEEQVMQVTEEDRDVQENNDEEMALEANETQENVEAENGSSSSRSRKTGKKMWDSLKHEGPAFTPPYEPLPTRVKFLYDCQEMALSVVPDTHYNCSSQEVAGFYARMDKKFKKKKKFNDNFFEDWRKVMTETEREKIKDFSKCNFEQINKYFKTKKITKLEKLNNKKYNERLKKKHGYCKIDGNVDKISNFRIEPPGLFIGRGNHPYLGKLKKRVRPEDVTINCSDDGDEPKLPPGHKWFDVIHDNTVSWLASWIDNVQGEMKLIRLDTSSKLKGEEDKEKYDLAQRLHHHIKEIRQKYKTDWRATDLEVRQCAVALYFIDLLALRAGNDKPDSKVDTVGCCSLRVEHIKLHPEKDNNKYVVVFNFTGKDTIRYYNEVPVKRRVFKNLQTFVKKKIFFEKLFDKLNTRKLNKYLNSLMPGLTAKVFRTYRASITLQRYLKKLTDGKASRAANIIAYETANYKVAALCNHKKTVSGEKKRKEKAKLSKELDILDTPNINTYMSGETTPDQTIRARLKNEMHIRLTESDSDATQTINTESSKRNYLDPRITVAWCKKYKVPLEKIFSPKQMKDFAWAINTTGPDYVFVQESDESDESEESDANEESVAREESDNSPQ